MHLYWPAQYLWFIGGLPPKERVALHWKLPSCATQSFTSHWLTRERGQAHWPVASSYALLRASQLRSCMVSLEVISGFAVYVKCSPIYTILFFQILSKLKRMTLLSQKAKAVISTSKMLFYLTVSHLWLVGVIWYDVQFDVQILSYDLSLFFFFWFRLSVTQAHDISNPSYMGVPFQKGNVIDKGWSYSMPPKNLPVIGQGNKEAKKAGSPTGKSINLTWVFFSFFFFFFKFPLRQPP